MSTNATTTFASRLPPLTQPQLAVLAQNLFDGRDAVGDKTGTVRTQIKLLEDQGQTNTLAHAIKRTELNRCHTAGLNIMLELEDLYWEGERRKREGTWVMEDGYKNDGWFGVLRGWPLH